MKPHLPQAPKEQLGIFTLLFFFCIGLTVAQNTERDLRGYELDGNELRVKVSDGEYIFTSYTPEIMETSFIPSGERKETASASEEDRESRLAPYEEGRNTSSHAVVLEPRELEVELRESGATIELVTQGLRLVINKVPFQVSYYYEGELVISEKEGYTSEGGMEELTFNLREHELLFGGGARALGMNRRGNRLELYNQAHYGYGSKSDLLNYSLPIVLSSEKYLLHFDNAPRGYLDLDSEHQNELRYGTIGGRKTYQVVVGTSWAKLMENYTLLTGRQPMPPRWALGNFSSRFGYHSRREVEATIQKFKEDSIPVDAVILDLFWFGHEIKGTMGNLEFVQDSFPNPEKMMSDLAKQGIKTILVTEPFILTTSKRWEEAVEEEVLATDTLGRPFTFDFYFGHTGLLDIFKPEAQEWFWNIYQDLIEKGVSGWWGDLGEPEVHPAELQHVLGTADEVHNIYGHYWAKTIYEGYENNFPQQRPFLLMRAGAAGSQRYGLIPWSGDVSRSWGGLKSQPEISLQMGLQGLAYMHSDLGGFAGDLENNELYVRWLQYGVFQPLFRPHAQEIVASEPVFKEPETKALAKKAIELRYRLLPYNYTLSFENSQTGMPLMRPLFFEEPENYRLYHYSNTYLWGSDFLVSPIVRPGKREKEIYFPSGNNWYDFYTGEKFSKGTTATVEVRKEHIPTFVRGGAFIPLAAPMQTTESYSVAELELHYYFDEEVTSSTGQVYHDNGEMPGAYKKEAYELLHLASEYRNGVLGFRFQQETGADFESEIKDLQLVVHSSKKPETVRVNGKNRDFQWNEEERSFRFQVSLSGKTTVKIKID